MGVLGLLVALVLAVAGAVDGPDGLPAEVVAAALVGAVLVWATMLKPGVAVEGRLLVLRNSFETVRIPLAAVEELAVRQVLAVRVGKRRFVSPALGRSLRQVVKGGSAPRPDAAGAAALATKSYPDYVEDRLRRLVDDARAMEGVARFSPEQEDLARQVRREPAWLEIGLLTGTVVAFVAALVL
ncbi:hypothetical protein [Nocardioides dongkuii]|uniref:hypothetical protein n=1 Tax=Nocardioides dongkuii TaxID=2760089 RepID=UPI0015F7CC07|nr:hypothetical protein [Nocardioides dongkuii]